MGQNKDGGTGGDGDDMGMAMEMSAVMGQG